MRYLSILLALLVVQIASAAPTITTLGNGMEVMLIENHSNPVIASVVVVRTGLRNETIELNGATHFLEHLLFNGTATRTQKQLYDEMDFLGGYNNANTAQDRTTFMILLEKSNFEKGLEIQADMLFNSILPPDKFEKEKGIVTEEIGKDEDSEDYRVEHFFNQALYRGTPYQWPILGSRESIRRLTRDQVYDYYRTYYVPNNMVALIMGDFRTPDMLKMIEKVFGQKPPGTLPEGKPLRASVLDQAQGVGAAHYLNQGEASAHHVRIALPAPTRASSDYCAFMILSGLLSDRLEQDLQADPALGVTEVSASPFLDRDFGILQVDLTIEAKMDYQPALETFHKSLTAFIAQQFAAEKVQAAATSLRAEEIFNSERPHYYGMLKAEDLAQAGPYFLLDYQERLSRVTPQDVSRLAQKYLGSAYPVVLVYQALAAEQEAAAAGSAKKTQRRQLPNGLLAVVEENQDSRVFAAHFLFKNRSAVELACGGKIGMVDFVHHLFDYGPQGVGKEKFQSQLQALGAQVKFYDMAFIPYDDYYTTPEFSYVRVEALDENCAAVMDLISRTLQNPAFTPEAVEATRGQMSGLARRSQGSVPEKGRALFRSLLYGNSPLACDIIGSADSLAAFTLSDLQKFQRTYFSPGNLVLTIVTSNNADSVMHLIEKDFGSWPAQELPAIPALARPVLPAAQQEKAGGKEQSYLAMGYSFDLASPQDQAPLAILNAIISDRMQFQLREKEGLAYTLGSSVNFYSGWGVWAATIGTGPQNLERAQEGIRAELDRAAAEKFLDQDVAKARNAYLGRQLMRGLSRINQAYQMGLGELRGEGAYRYAAWLQELQQVTAADLARVARQYLTSKALSIAIMR